MATPLVPLTMFGWIPFSLYLASRFSIQRAVIIGFIVAWLLLPIAIYPFPGIPDLSKQSATSYGVLLSLLVFAPERILNFRPGWWDLPIILFCLSPIPTSLVNTASTQGIQGLTLYDGVTGAVSLVVSWGIPYFAGRICLGNLQGVRQLAIGIFLGGLAYVPLSLFEIRMSPQLHQIFYGYFPHSFGQTFRYGGWRPQVFMRHGLELGLWMLAATLIGIWLWRAKTLKKVWGIPMAVVVPILIGTFILVKSTGAWGLCIIGVIVLFVGASLRTSLLAFGIAGLISFHLLTNTLFVPTHTDALMSFLNSTPLSEDRIGSLQFRFDQEKVLAERAKEQLLFGWGGYDRPALFDENGQKVSTTDSLWIVEFGARGIFGTYLTFMIFILPATVALWRKCPAKVWKRPDRGPVAALAVTLLLYAVDCLVNAMINPVFILASGALSGYAFSKEEEAPRHRIVRARKLRRHNALPQQRSVAAPVPRRQPRRRRVLTSRTTR